ncbi:hypothetical protein L9F63_015455, partial [Diploptera punctata]
KALIKWRYQRTSIKKSTLKIHPKYLVVKADDQMQKFRITKTPTKYILLANTNSSLDAVKANTNSSLDAVKANTNSSLDAVKANTNSSLDAVKGRIYFNRSNNCYVECTHLLLWYITGKHKYIILPEEFLREAFNLRTLFNKEARTYVLVCPELIRLQEEMGIPADDIMDVFPKFYGARTNTQEDLFQEADPTAILLLENLKTSGYFVGERRKGFDLKHVEFVVTQLARFHALTLALKIHKPLV